MTAERAALAELVAALGPLQMQIPTPILLRVRAALAAPAQEPVVPAYRGYAALGTGQYAINHSRAGEPPELVITLATEDEKRDRQIGEPRDNPPDAPPIQADEMIIRIAFTSERGLFALEDQLAWVRRVHFTPDPFAAPAQGEPQDYANDEWMLDQLCDGDSVAMVGVPRGVLRSLRSAIAALRAENERQAREIAEARGNHMTAEGRLDSVSLMLAGADAQIEKLARAVAFHERNALRAEAERDAKRTESEENRNNWIAATKTASNLRAERNALLDECEKLRVDAAGWLYACTRYRTCVGQAIRRRTREGEAMNIDRLRALATKLHSLYEEHEEACEINDATSGGDLRECRLAEGCYRVSVVLPALLGRLEAAERDAARWDTFCNLWAHYTEMKVTQDEDGRWSITGVEAVKADPWPGHWTGDDPDAAIDAAREGK